MSILSVVVFLISVVQFVFSVFLIINLSLFTYYVLTLCSVVTESFLGGAYYLSIMMLTTHLAALVAFMYFVWSFLKYSYP